MALAQSWEQLVVSGAVKDYCQSGMLGAVLFSTGADHTDNELDLGLEPDINPNTTPPPPPPPPPPPLLLFSVTAGRFPCSAHDNGWARSD